MSEVSQDPIEGRIEQREQEVKEGLKRIEELTEIKYLPGFEERAGYFPRLESLPGRPLLARFSYGKDAPNMSELFFNSEKGESQITGERNTREFLQSQGFTGPTIQVLGRFEGVEPQIEEVNLTTLKDKNKVAGNMIFTRDPEVTLMIKPADCPVAVIYCKDKNGNPLVGIDHAGRDAIDAGMTRQGLWYLQDELGVDLSEVVIVVFPGVFPENYFITNEPERRGKGISEYNWGEFITPKQTDDPAERRYVDILSAFEMQAIQAGIKPENIQAYRIDTYEDAIQGKAFSRRYSDEHNGEHPGGQLVAVQLKPKSVQENLSEFSKAA